MAEPSKDPPSAGRRRARYRGTHPRSFAETYKELAPEEHPDVIARVRARGMTPAGQHVPILVEEMLAALEPRPGERGVDATLGWGGHAERLLERLAPGGTLLGIDVDPIELPKTRARLERLGTGEGALTVRRTNFAGLLAALHEVGWHDGADFVLADLGLSSMQIDDPARGFSYKSDGPLDMRMNPARGLSAELWLEHASADALAASLEELSDEPQARRIAEALDARRGRLRTTCELAQAVRTSVEGLVGEEEAELCVRRVFQAVRIAVNDELGALDSFLRQLPGCLRAGGRAAVLTFHSGEDRRGKKAFQSGLREGTYSPACTEVVRAGATERRDNPRSAAAKLRWARRGGVGP